MAERMAGQGRVTVSLLKSIIFMALSCVAVKELFSPL